MMLIRVDDPRLLCCILYQRHTAPCLWGSGEVARAKATMILCKYGQIQQAKRPWTLRYNEWETAGLRLFPIPVDMD